MCEIDDEDHVDVRRMYEEFPPLDGLDNTSRTVRLAKALLSTTRRTPQHQATRIELNWGSGGREFESPQPDGKTAGQSRSARAGSPRFRCQVDNEVDNGVAESTSGTARREPCSSCECPKVDFGWPAADDSKPSQHSRACEHLRIGSRSTTSLLWNCLDFDMATQYESPQCVEAMVCAE